MYIAQPETFLETQFIKVVFGKFFGITVHITSVVTMEFCSKLYLVNCVWNHCAYHISCDEGILWPEEKRCYNALFNLFQMAAAFS